MIETVKYKKDSDNDRFALGCFGIVLFILSPLWIGQMGAYITKSFLNKPCSESTDCSWLILSDYVYYTLPLGALLLLLYIPLWLLTNHELDVSEPPLEDSIEGSTESDEP